MLFLLFLFLLCLTQQKDPRELGFQKIRKANEGLLFHVLKNFSGVKRKTQHILKRETQHIWVTNSRAESSQRFVASLSVKNKLLKR